MTNPPHYNTAKEESTKLDFVISPAHTKKANRNLHNNTYKTYL